ncbi:unnamed protein product [Cuscuta europaea]|uniref:Uncharacterized protein n=1 Tax=Cuscuta europaea TaxID=41803 RepID=A0A9P1EKB8_CUSEU|nr:unnamed protein product [Cuscuta europaea]
MKSYGKNIPTEEDGDESAAHDSILPRSTAIETLNAASELGLIYTLTEQDLLSARSAARYNSILLAEQENTIYFSLDKISETSSVEKISPARARAMARVVDSIISNYFKNKNYHTKTDMIKYVMMLIRGSMRGSVHRDRPYNSRVLREWGKILANRVYEFFDYISPNYREIKERGSRGYHKYEPLREDELAYFRDYLESTESSDVELGHVSQYDQAVKFLVNLAKWGTLPNMMPYLKRLEWPASVDDIYYDFIEPALKLVRTVSYKTVEKALETISMDDTMTGEDKKTLDDVVSYLLSPFGKDVTFYNLLSAEPLKTYRGWAGSLSNLDIRFNFPDYDESHFAHTLAYSLAIPLLLASGRIGFTTIQNVLLANYSDSVITIAPQLSSYCLPLLSEPDGMTLGILVGVSEDDIEIYLPTWLGRTRGPRMCIVEVPPNASAFSLGLIKWLTNHDYTYVTVALSTDKKGVSIYVAAIIDTEYPEVEKRMLDHSDRITSLGDTALSNYIDLLQEGDHHLLSSLSLSPLHQCGIPASASILTGNTYKFLHVEEELLDRHTVFFVESGRPTASTQIISRLEPMVGAYLIKALRMKKSSNQAAICIMSGAYFYYRAIFPEIDPENLRRFILSLVGDCSRKMIQEIVLRHLVDPLSALPDIPISSLPTKAQMLESELEDFYYKNFRYFKTLDNALISHLDVYGKHILPDSDVGALTRYIRDHKENLDPDDVREFLLDRESEENEVISGVATAIPRLARTSYSSLERLISVERRFLDNDIKRSGSGSLEVIKEVISMPLDIDSTTHI